LFVAWHAVAQRGRSLVAIAGFSSELGKRGEPTLVAGFGDPDPEASALALVKREGGGAVLAAFTGHIPCEGLFPEQDRGSCQRMEVVVFDRTGLQARSETRMLDGGEGGIDDLLALEKAALVAFHVYHGGPLTDLVVVPYDATTPVRVLESCGYPPIDVAFVDGSVVTICPDPDNDTTAELGCKAKKGSSCGLVSRTSLEENERLPPSSTEKLDVAITSLRCANGRVTVEAGGTSLEIPGDMLELGEPGCR
jgi:hypothetical protein